MQAISASFHFIIGSTRTGATKSNYVFSTPPWAVGQMCNQYFPWSMQMQVRKVNNNSDIVILKYRLTSAGSKA